MIDNDLYRLIDEYKYRSVDIQEYNIIKKRWTKRNTVIHKYRCKYRQLDIYCRQKNKEKCKDIYKEIMLDGITWKYKSVDEKMETQIGMV